MAYQIDTRTINQQNLRRNSVDNIAYNDPWYALGQLVGGSVANSYISNYENRANEKDAILKALEKDGYGTVTSDQVGGTTLDDVKNYDNMVRNEKENGAISVSGSPQAKYIDTVIGNNDDKATIMVSPTGTSYMPVAANGVQEGIQDTVSAMKKGADMEKKIEFSGNNGTLTQTSALQPTVISFSGNPDLTKKEQPSDVDRAISEGENVIQFGSDTINKAIESTPVISISADSPVLQEGGREIFVSSDNPVIAIDEARPNVPTEASTNPDGSINSAPAGNAEAERIFSLQNGEQAIADTEKQGADTIAFDSATPSEKKEIARDKVVEMSQDSASMQAIRKALATYPQGEFNAVSYLRDRERQLADFGVNGYIRDNILAKDKAEAIQIETQQAVSAINKAFVSNNMAEYNKQVARLQAINPDVAVPYRNGIISAKDKWTEANRMAQINATNKSRENVARFNASTRGARGTATGMAHNSANDEQAQSLVAVGERLESASPQERQAILSQIQKQYGFNEAQVLQRIGQARQYLSEGTNTKSNSSDGSRTSSGSKSASTKSGTTSTQLTAAKTAIQTYNAFKKANPSEPVPSEIEKNYQTATKLLASTMTNNGVNITETALDKVLADNLKTSTGGYQASPFSLKNLDNASKLNKYNVNLSLYDLDDPESLYSLVNRYMENNQAVRDSGGSAFTNRALGAAIVRAVEAQRGGAKNDMIRKAVADMLPVGLGDESDDDDREIHYKETNEGWDMASQEYEKYNNGL